MFYASQRPGFFGSAAAFSGPLSIQRPTYQAAFDFATGQSKEAIFGDPEAQEFYWRGHNPKALVDNLTYTRLYVAAGDGVPNPARPSEATNTFGQAAEAELGQHAAEFVTAAEDAGVDVTYRPHQGIHDWPYWREDLADAIDWGFFRRPEAHRARWSYETVAQQGTAWSIQFAFAEAPTELIRFRRDGRRLLGEGSGRVTLRRDSCRVRVDLPFQIRFKRLRDRAPGPGCR